MDIPRHTAKWKQWLSRGVYVGTAITALAAITLGVSRTKPADPGVETSSVVIDTVKRGPMVREVRGYGKLVPEEMHWITAATEGRVERILVQPGPSVQPETVLLELSNPVLELEMVDAEMQLKASEAELASLRIRLKQDQLAQKAAFATLEAEYRQATLDAGVNEELAKGGLIPSVQLKTSQGKVEELTTRYEIEKERLGMNGDSDEAQLAAQQARVDQYRAMAQLKERQMELLHVRAGTDGVLAQMQVEEGQSVTPGTNLARVANPNRLKAEVKIAETQAKDVAIGQAATIDTHNGIIAGRVARIDPAVQEGFVAVDVALEGELPDGARQDLSVDGTVELERLKDVLYVGRPAFGQDKSTVGMFRLEDRGTKAERVQVKLGRSSVTNIELLEGLKEGDQVILSDMSAWDSFDRVRLNGAQ